VSDAVRHQISHTGLASPQGGSLFDRRSGVKLARVQLEPVIWVVVRAGAEVGCKEVVVLVDRLRQGLGPVVQVLHRVAGRSHHCTALNQPWVTAPTNLTIYLLVRESREGKNLKFNFFSDLIFLLGGAS